MRRSLLVALSVLAPTADDRAHAQRLLEPSDIDELRVMPDLVRQWIHYVNERCQMPPGMATESIERVDECKPFYLAIVESRARSLAEFTNDLITDRQ